MYHLWQIMDGAITGLRHTKFFIKEKEQLRMNDE